METSSRHYLSKLVLNNDNKTHWCWEAAENMPLYKYKAALIRVAALFEKIT